MTKQFSSVWTRPPRRPKTSGLGREQIVAAAIELLDAEGLQALSMRKLGAKLGAGATSLYWYVANKDELLELALDEMWGKVELPDPDTVPWREVASALAYNLRNTMRSHPWMVELIGRMPSLGPSMFRLNERLRRTFLAADFHGVDVYLASGTVVSFVLGQVVPEIAYAESGHLERFDVEALQQAVRQQAADYPEMSADFQQMAPMDQEAGRAMAFDFGLLCVLEGLEARLRAAQERA
ncbi:TetR/AcrR family transcriptional regulator [Nocardia transvalensis]|uniref:TetR/AcrR family transcriptional regulator n=1 Tax=Nocardia transvalensis TaxID=37333 RepID=UPI001894A443|nr:TetR/AcrR family transcriptional regulator C-terminal domain-containing protein [Nocardia transvalensis]MBF6327992.1 TetR/AcrR family transcriptional regulator C-terminal domain-containing protein [Nocardia transvalensis]